MEISLTQNLERKKKEHTQGRTKRRRPIFNPTIQLVVVNLYTNFEVSVLNNCGDIFDEKSGEKEKKNKFREEQIGELQKAHFQSHDTICRCEPVYQIWSFYLKRLWRYFWRKIWRERKKTNIGKNKQEKADFQSHDTICRCEPVYQIWSFYLKQFWRYLWWKIWKERKRNK